MSKTNFYQTDFKPDYEVFQQKISQLSSQKSRIPKKQTDLQKLKHELQLIRQQIDDQGLEYDEKNTIFVRYASIQQLAHKKKTASDCCVHCGQEMKKTVQCQICAQVYCKNCCWRKRVIPFGEHQDFRLCCEQCHQKYIKHFNNQQFYRQKGIYLAAIEELERKYEKAKTKYDKKQLEVNEYKQQKKKGKVRQGNLKKSLLDEQKRIKNLTQQFQKAVKQRAVQIKAQEEKIKQRQVEDMQKKREQEEQKRRLQKKRISRLEESEKKLQEVTRLREEELARRQAQIQRQKQLLEKEKRELSQSRLRQLQQLDNNKSEPKTPIKLTNLPTQEHVQQKNIISQQTPRRIISVEQIDFDSILKDKPQSQSKIITSQQPAKTQIQIKQQQPSLKQLLKDIKLSKKVGQNVQIQKKVYKQPKQQNQHQQPSIEPEQNEAPCLTMDKIKTMSINDLLSMKIPMNPSATKQKKPRKSSHPQIKLDAQQNSTTTQNQKMYQSMLEPGIPQQPFMVGLAIPNDQGQESCQKKSEKLRESVHSVHEIDKEMDEKQKASNKKALLRRQSLISSAHKVSITSQDVPKYNQEEETAGQPQKCTCEIM